MPPIASHGLPSFILYQGWPASYFGYSRYSRYSRYFGYSRYSRTLTTTLSASSRTLTTNALSLLSYQPPQPRQPTIYIYIYIYGTLEFLWWLGEDYVLMVADVCEACWWLRTDGRNKNLVFIRGKEAHSPLRVKEKSPTRKPQSSGSRFYANLVQVDLVRNIRQRICVKWKVMTKKEVIKYFKSCKYDW